ncbi:MAG: galactokinase [Elusimicrobia bacterium RIFOXYA2_FULL_39_19]|nr:MAG: galactokinase [Elusimicrobia bacterium RIFOXYA2_FULL_39_19]
MTINLKKRIEQIYGKHYPELKKTINRYEGLIKQFKKVYPKAGRFSIYRAPGRINIIGEHTDYNGMPVFPMTIDKDIVIIAAPRKDNEVIYKNVDSKNFQDRNFIIEKTIHPYTTGDWGNYLKAAVQLVVDSKPKNKYTGYNAMISGNVPSNSGVSSSSALIVANAVAFADINRIKFKGLEFAKILADGEWYVGTQGGGMDQTISLLGNRGKALKIDFYPMEVESIPVPEEMIFVACNSMVSAPKSGHARQSYNMRVFECRLGVLMLNKYITEKFGTQYAITKLGDLRFKKFEKITNKIEEIINKVFQKETCTEVEIAQSLELTVEELRAKHLKLKNGEPFRSDDGYYKIKSRCRHVLLEWKRVEESTKAFKKCDMAKLGELMNQSHLSLDMDYEVSCPELNEMVKIAGNNGAFGSRLTGAGFGGCTINLVTKRTRTKFIKAIKKLYYNKRKLKPQIFEVYPTEHAGKVI